MNFAKRILMFVGFVVLAAILTSVLAPKATHALVATLVQVSNTPSSPVPNRDVDSPAHATVVPLGCFASPQPFNGGGTCARRGRGGSAYSVPGGPRLGFEPMARFWPTNPNGGIPFIEFNLT